MTKKILTLALALSFALSSVPFALGGTLYDDGEIVIDSTHIYPKTDGGSTVGKSGKEFAGVFTDSITLGGVAKTSWGSVISPMTDESDHVKTTDGGDKVKLYDAGYIHLGDDSTNNDFYILFDGSTDDWAVGLETADDDFTISFSTALGTDDRLKIVDDADNTVIVIGDGVNSYDKSIIFDGDEFDYYIAYDDSADDLLIGKGAAIGTTPAISITDGLAITTYADITMTGTTPVLTIGDGGTEDTQIVFDGVTQDYYICLDDSTTYADDLCFGLGSVVGTTVALSIAETLVSSFHANVIIDGTTPKLTIGDGGAEDIQVFFNGTTGEDWCVGVDTNSDKFEIVNHTDLSGTVALSIDSSEDIIIPSGSLFMIDDEYINFGTNSDYQLKYDETTNDQFIVTTTAVAADATGDPMFAIIIDDAGSGCTAEQEVFGVARGTAGATDLLTLDEDGDMLIKGSLALSAGDDLLTVTDDELRFASNDNASTIAIYGFDDKDAILVLDADTGDDDEDSWILTSNQSGNAFTIANHTSTYLTIDDADGDITTAGDIEIVENMDLVIGAVAGTDWKIGFDEATDDQLLIQSALTAAIATTDPMVEILVDTGHALGTSMTANQQVFGVAKGTQDSNTALLTLDEDGDLTFGASLIAIGGTGASSTVASSSTNLAPASLPYTVLCKYIGGNGGLDETDIGSRLPNGTPGKILVLIAQEVDTDGSWIVTPTTSVTISNLTFDAKGETTTLLWLNDYIGWIVLANEGTTVTLKDQSW